MNHTIPAPASERGREVGELATWLVADWRHMLFVHSLWVRYPEACFGLVGGTGLSVDCMRLDRVCRGLVKCLGACPEDLYYRIPAETLQPHVPHPLDLWEGNAWVSLVFFRMQRMRPPGTGALGRALMCPISDHAFLNLRTYVRAEAGPGIHFLAEWIPNRLSTWLGPATYGLPYRLGRFDCELSGQATGVGRVVVEDPQLHAGLSLIFPSRRTMRSPARGDPTDEFLLERYTAYTCRAGVRRCFRVAHAPWQIQPVDWIRADTAMIAVGFPWFASAELYGAHLTPGVRDFQMSRPARLLARMRAESALLDLQPTRG